MQSSLVLLKASHAPFLHSHIVVDIGFEQMMYTATEDGGFVDITFGIRNNVRISSSSDPVEVQFEAMAGTALGE